MTKATPIIVDGRALGVFTRGGNFHPTPNGLPSEVRVSGDVWKVLFHSRLYLTAKAKAPLLGVAIPSERVLIADPQVPDYELRDTVFHEVVHAWLHVGRQQDARLAKLSKEAEEAIAEVIARELVRSGWR